MFLGSRISHPLSPTASPWNHSMTNARGELTATTLTPAQACKDRMKQQRQPTDRAERTKMQVYNACVTVTSRLHPSGNGSWKRASIRSFNFRCNRRILGIVRKVRFPINTQVPDQLKLQFHSEYVHGPPAVGGTLSGCVREGQERVCVTICTTLSWYSSVLVQLYVPTSLCSNISMFQTAYIPKGLSSYSSVFQQLNGPPLYVPTARYSHTSMFQQLYVPTVLCSHSFIFPQFYVPCSHSSMLPQFYVPKDLCLYGSMLLQLYVLPAKCFHSSM